LPSNNNTLRGPKSAGSTKEGRSGHTTSRMLHGCNHVCCTLNVALLTCCSLEVCRMQVACCMLYVARCKPSTALSGDGMRLASIESWRGVHVLALVLCGQAGVTQAWTDPRNGFGATHFTVDLQCSLSHEKAEYEYLGSDMLRQTWAEIKGPRHGRIETERNHP
jgi:hypothetical protein